MIGAGCATTGCARGLSGRRRTIAPAAAAASRRYGQNGRRRTRGAFARASPEAARIGARAAAANGSGRCVRPTARTSWPGARAAVPARRVAVAAAPPRTASGTGCATCACEARACDAVPAGRTPLRAGIAPTRVSANGSAPTACAGARAAAGVWSGCAGGGASDRSLFGAAAGIAGAAGVGGVAGAEPAPAAGAGAGSAAGGAASCAGAAGAAAGTGVAGAVATGAALGEPDRRGRSESGSTYPCGSLVTRMPRCTYGCECSESPLDPIDPTAAPSATVAPRRTSIEPRWSSVTEYPSCVWIVTLLPPLGTVPAKLTTPPAGAGTASPPAPATSIPRCWPAAYGWSGSNE